MAAHATNKTNLGSVESAVATLKSNAGLGGGDAKHELVKLAKALQREIDYFKGTIQGLS